jgi:beta-galactosidase
LHSTNPRRFDYTTEWGERFHESHLAQILERPRLCGSAVWNQFDFAVESRGDSIPHLNQKGLCTYDRRPKDVYYLYQARLAQRPVLHIATTEWTHRTAWTDAALRPVKVYSNCGRVELFHNGASLGEKVPKDGFAEWPVEFADGENQLVARGVRGDRPVEAKASVQFERLDWTNFAELRVNAGADVEYRSAAPSHQPSVRDAAWLPDRAYAPGAWGAVGGTNRPESSGPNVRGTDDDPLYQSYLEGLEAYRFDCPDGEYELDLHFAEMSAKAPGERVFRVTVNGTEVIRDLDLFATAGRCRAQSVSLPVTARGGEGIRVEFSARVGKTLLNGIRLARRPGAPAR